MPLLLILVRKRYRSYPPTFTKQAEEEKAHALRFIQFVIDTGARVNIPAVPATQAHFKVAEDAVGLSLEQEEHVTTQINALVSMARAESDYTADNFLQWFVKERWRSSPRTDGC